MPRGNEIVQEVVRYNTYSRWLPEKKRRETWAETVERVVGFFQKELLKQNKDISRIPWADLSTAMLKQDVLPSMRAVQMAGPAAERDHTHLYNCSYLPLDGPTALKELLYILMCGTGVGYSVEKRYIEKWRKPTIYNGIDPTNRLEPYVIEDSSLGWAEAFHRAIDLSLEGIEPKFDYGRIRPKGTWLRTKGGRASGPEPLRRLLTSVWTIISARKGNALTPFDVHRIACIAGSIVDVGGVRRAALISLFDPDDQEMLNCKTGDWYDRYPELAKANNSAVAAMDDIRGIFHTLSTNGYGEPGLFNRYSRKSRAYGVEYGTNPCGEILLEPHQFCNLSIAVARPDDTWETLREKVALATIWGTIQSCMTYFPHLRPEWTINCNRERLLGVDITGTQDCPLLQQQAVHALESLEDLRDYAHEINREFAHKLAIPASAAVTCNKPSGNSSQLVDCSSGIHARWSEYYIRRITIEGGSPLGLRLREKGIPYVDLGYSWLFEFPIKSPEGSTVRNQIDALDQLNYWFMWQTKWCDHNASSTIYVEPENWRTIEATVMGIWHNVGGLSFLPKDDHQYENAPYEEITKEEYERRVALLPEDLELTTIVENEDSKIQFEPSCSGGVCEF